MDAQCPGPQLWIRSTEVRGVGGEVGGGGGGLGEWEHNNNRLQEWPQDKIKILIDILFRKYDG